MRRDIIYCDTPYQIFTAINIVQNGFSSLKPDIVIKHQFRGAETLSQNLKQSELFNNVYDVYGKDNNVNEIFTQMLANCYLKLIIGISNNEYENFFFSILDTRVSLAMYVGLKYKNAVLYDDGTGSYHGHILYDYFGKNRRRIIKLFHPNVKCFNISRFLLYSPEMNKSRVEVSPQRLKVSVSEAHYKIFEYKENNLYKSLYVYLDQGYGGDLKDEYDEKVNKVLSDSKIEIVARLHPRMKNTKINCGTIDTYNNQWELECCRQITDNHTLISIYSTALFQPAVLNGKHPNLIFLFYLYKKMFNEIKIEEFEETIKSFKEAYPICKVFTPKTWEELHSIINKTPKK